MPKYTVALPDSVATWILQEKKVQAGTFIENEIVKRIIKEYEKSATKARVTAAEAEVKKEIDLAKKAIKVTEKQ